MLVRFPCGYRAVSLASLNLSQHKNKTPNISSPCGWRAGETNVADPGTKELFVLVDDARKRRTLLTRVPRNSSPLGWLLSCDVVAYLLNTGGILGLWLRIHFGDVCLFREVLARSTECSRLCHDPWIHAPTWRSCLIPARAASLLCWCRGRTICVGLKFRNMSEDNTTTCCCA